MFSFLWATDLLVSKSAAGQSVVAPAAGQIDVSLAAGQIDAMSAAGQIGVTSAAGQIDVTSAAGQIGVASAAGQNNVTATPAAGQIVATSAVGLKPFPMEWPSRYLAVLGIPQMKLMASFADGIFVAASCAGAGAFLHACEKLLGKANVHILSANDKSKSAHTWLKRNYNCGCVFGDCSCWRAGGACSIHGQTCRMKSVQEEVLCASAPSQPYSKANNLAKERLLLPTQDPRGWPIIEISQQIDAREPKIYFGEQVAEVLKPYKDTLAVTPEEKAFVSAYPRPWDYFLYGEHGLARKTSYHLAWWVRPARDYGAAQTRNRIYYVLARKDECDVAAFNQMVHVASTTLCTSHVTNVRELRTYCQAVAAPEISVEASQAGRRCSGNPVPFPAIPGSSRQVPGTRRFQTASEPSSNPVQTQSQPSPNPVRTKAKADWGQILIL